MLKQTFEMTLSPRFSETDGMGHISNTVIPIWFEAARDPIFEIFVPSMKMADWNLILAGFNVTFSAPSFYGKSVTIITNISRIGSASFEVYQRCMQDGKLTAEGRTTMVHYDYENESSMKLSEEIKERLNDYHE
ncbi:acyl-CoA thioesterase [Shewanella sp. 202IG2-18]|uniref:acyl-CoA thioesterase n=1 Tax=Parashewanella hymeniacidonis TaxID=2807618 RepID=UPI001961C65F|nr:thioesterase family protein [Parashewanella hymeniacidonis]MBM7071828.1 acyl-CoA thioesterase [Parashewanella hymeniacidonis]